MKRKLALMLAAVMAMSISVMPTSVFAASDNRITQTYPSLNDDTLLVGRDFSGYGGSTNATATTVKEWGSDARVGTELTVEFKQGSKRETYFRLDLENAEWFFKAQSGSQDLEKSMTDVYEVLSNAGLSTSAYDGMSSEAALSVMIQEMGFGNPTAYDPEDIREDMKNLTDYRDNSSVYYAGTRAGQPVATFATESGLWIAPTGSGTWSDKVDERINNTTYIGYYIGLARQKNGGPDNVAYVLGVHPDRTRADVVLLTDVASNDRITIPMPIMTGDEELPVTLSVDGQTSGGDVSNSKLTIVGAVAGATTAKIKDINTGRKTVELADVTITETRLGTIQAGVFHIDAPTGYKFVNTVGTVTATAFSISTTPKESGMKSTSDRDADTPGDITYPNANQRRMDVYLDLGTDKSQRVFGYVVITGLEVEPLSTNTWGDITGLKLTNASKSPKAGISDYTFGLVGKRTDYGVSLLAADSKEGVPPLFTGVLVASGAAFAEGANDDSTKLMEIKLTENTPHSWWTGRDTKLTLPEGVYVRGIAVTDGDNIVLGDDVEVEMDAAGKMSQTGTVEGGWKSGYLSFEKNVITIGDIRSNNADKEDKNISISMDIYVSVSNRMADKDIEISVSGGGMDSGTTPEPLLVATAVAPVTVSTKTTTIGIGRLSQSTADITIEETYAGALRADSDIRILITDEFGNSAIDTLDFVSAEVEVTDGDLEYDSRVNWNDGNAFGISTARGGQLGVRIDAESTKASTIVFSNVKISAATTLPWVDNVSYQILVYGTAIAENYNSAKDSWKHGYFGDIKKDAGIFANYLYTSTTSNPGTFDPTDELVMALEAVDGNIYCTVNGTERNIPEDSAPFLQGNTVYLPLRAISEAFGLAVDWDSEQSIAKVTVSNNPYKAIEFMPNHQWYYINKVSSEMKYQETGEVVTPITKNERLFIPLRFLGLALGVAYDNIQYVPEPSEGDKVSVPAVYFNKRQK